MHCADNSGAKNLYVVAVCGIGGVLNRLPQAGMGDMVMCSVKKGKPELRKKMLTGVVVRCRKAIRRGRGVFINFEDNPNYKGGNRKWFVSKVMVILHDLAAVEFSEGHIGIVGIYRRHSKPDRWDLVFEVGGVFSERSYPDPPKPEDGEED